jgi:apolipoprotein D and lipocalin family protein
MALALSFPAVAEQPPVTSVPAVDLARYVGKWYEIAAFPMYFQRNCVGDTTAEYTLRPDGEVTVDNRCRTASAGEHASGRAWAVEGTGNAQLKVSFFWPFRSDYWVIGLDGDYRWAVVGNPNRKYLWVLSRTPTLDEATWQAIDARIAAAGYDRAKGTRTAVAAK